MKRETILGGQNHEHGPIELSVIIPTFNEAKNVALLLEKLSAALGNTCWEAVFVDDNSPDGTADAVRRIALGDRRVRIIQRIGRRGLSSAVVEGMLATAAPVLAVIDGDLQHDETILPAMLDDVASGRADIAIGSRYMEGGSVGDWSQKREAGSRAATALSKFALKVELSDPMSGFFAISRAKMMDAVPNLSGIGFKILLDLVASLKTPPRISEHPYTFRSRAEGESKASALVAAEYLLLLLDKRVGHIIPARFLSFLAVGGLGVGVHLAVLWTMLQLGAGFVNAQSTAVVLAMTFNFFLNNIFTYQDRQLHGWKMIGGLLSFYAVCGLGAVANVGIGTWMHAHDSQWWIAGFAGIAIGAVWNFAASSFLTWRK